MDDLLTLRQIAARARENLRDDVYDFVAGGASTEQTIRRNRAALDRLAIRQRALIDIREIDLRTRFCGFDLPVPFIIAPVGTLFEIRPEGELEVARAGGYEGGLTAISGYGGGFAFKDVVAASTGPLMWQLYWYGDRDWVVDRLERVQAAGFKAICMTVDNAMPSRRERVIESGYQAHPLEGPDKDPFYVGPDYRRGLTWKDIDWLRTQIRVPFGIKGLNDAEDARIALDHGVDFIWVSNHGGRQLDSARATIDTLPEIADAVAGRVPIVVDGGFARGTDVIKGLARGATLVAMGRNMVWGLAAAGEPGVRRVLEIVKAELVANLGLAGLTSSSSIPRETVSVVDY